MTLSCSDTSIDHGGGLTDVSDEGIMMKALYVICGQRPAKEVSGTRK
jgi:hypothetical protein